MTDDDYNVEDKDFFSLLLFEKENYHFSLKMNCNVSVSLIMRTA